MESVYAAFRCFRPLPFRGGAAAAAEGVVIYRLPCRAALFRAEKPASRQDSRAKQVY